MGKPKPKKSVQDKFRVMYILKAAASQTINILEPCVFPLFRLVNPSYLFTFTDSGVVFFFT